MSIFCRIGLHDTRVVEKQKIGYYGQDWQWAYLVECRKCDATWEYFELQAPLDRLHWRDGHYHYVVYGVEAPPFCYEHRRIPRPDGISPGWAPLENHRDQ